MSKQRNDRIERLNKLIPAELREFVFYASPTDKREPEQQLLDARRLEPDRWNDFVILTCCNRD